MIDLFRMFVRRVRMEWNHYRRMRILRTQVRNARLRNAQIQAKHSQRINRSRR